MNTIYYSKYDLAELLKLSVSTIDNKMKAGEIEYYKIGKSVRFDDAMVNLLALLSLRDDYPNITFEAYKVTKKGTIKTIR